MASQPVNSAPAPAASDAGSNGDQSTPVTPAAETWADVSSKFPSNMPLEAYEARRYTWFNQHVVPGLARQGLSYDDAWKAFVKASAPPVNFPRTNLAYSAAKEALVAPLASLGELVGDKGAPELKKSVKDQLTIAQREAALNGINPGPYQFAGGMVGAAPVFAAMAAGPQA